jgi:hypothetical protein
MLQHVHISLESRKNGRKHCFSVDPGKVEYLVTGGFYKKMSNSWPLLQRKSKLLAFESLPYLNN